MPFYRVHGADVFVEDSGGRGVPVVFLHGWLCDGRMFAEQVAALRPGFRCVTVDFRGAGRSGAARGGYQVEQHTADVGALLRVLGIDRCHLVGFSMGGFVAMRLAARDPGRVLSVTLGNTSARATPAGKVAEYLAVGGLIRAVGAGLPGDLDRGLFGQRFRADPGNRLVRQTWSRRRAELDRASAVHTLLGFMVRPDVRAELADIRCPALVVAGGVDEQTPVGEGREIHQLIPGSRFVELAEVGHCATLEAPTRFSNALVAFLGEVTSRPGVRADPGAVAWSRHAEPDAPAAAGSSLDCG